MNSPESLPLHGLTVLPCGCLANTTFAYRDLNELKVSPELYAALKSAPDGERVKCFAGITIMDPRSRQTFRG